MIGLERTARYGASRAEADVALARAQFDEARARKVVRIGKEMGPKNLRTDEPTERVDKKILETLIQLDDGHELPIGLRVDSFILVSQPPGSSPPDRSR